MIYYELKKIVASDEDTYYLVNPNSSSTVEIVESLPTQVKITLPNFE